MAKRQASRPHTLLTKTDGSLDWMAACVFDSSILALVAHSLNESNCTQVLPVLLDHEGHILSSSADLEIDYPRFADIVPTGPGEALLVVTSRPAGIGLVGVPHFFRCTVSAGRLRIQGLGAWRGGISIRSTSFFVRNAERIGFAAPFAATTRQTLAPGWQLAYGIIQDATQRPKRQFVSPTPSPNVTSIATALDGDGAWTFAAAVGECERIELWHDAGTGSITHRATLATASSDWPELGCPRIISRPAGYLVLWRAWNGHEEEDLCDGSIWYVQTDSALRPISPPSRWSPDRLVPARGPRLATHASSASLFWQNGMSAGHSPVRWSVLHANSSTPAAPRSINPPLPFIIVQVRTGFIALRAVCQRAPYQWRLTSELLPA